MNDINAFFAKYVNFTDSLCDRLGYSYSIRHLLYVIIPAFIIKYGMENEKTVIECFRNTKIYTKKDMPNGIEAYFGRDLLYDGKYYSEKYIVVKAQSAYLNFIDSIVHEFNHAINSMKNEIKILNNQVQLRTGLSYINYNINEFDKSPSKSKEFVLEEVINTKQSEDIINIISNMSIEKVDNEELSNVFLAVSHEIKNIKYKSSAYYLESSVCRELLNNKTFLSTIEKLRLNGEIESIDYWFDNITGNLGDYKKMVESFYEIHLLERKLSTKILFRKGLVVKMKGNAKNINYIIRRFNNNCIYK